MSDKEKLAIAIRALQDIADPWQRFERDGHVGKPAHMLLIDCSDNPETYKQFSREALIKITD